MPHLPCQLPGGDFCPADDDAAELVPADALGYLHANLDPDDEDYERAKEVGTKVPVLSGQIAERAIDLLPRPVGNSLDFDSDVRPWFGGEVALAMLPAAGRRPQPVVLLEADDADGADTFAERISVGVPHTEELDGVELSVGNGGLVTAQTNGFLVIGRRDAVGAIVDTATKARDAEPLASDEDATEVRDELPDHRFAEAYLSSDGVRELVADQRGTLATLTPLLSPGATNGAAASLTATEDGDLELAVRSVLDPERAKSEPGFFAAFPRFEPELPEKLPSGSLAYVGLGPPRTAVGALLEQAGEEAPGIAAGFEDLVGSLSDQIDIQRELLEPLGDEAAFALAPRGSEAGPATPFLEFVASGVDEDAARAGLAGLQGPLAQSVNPGSTGSAPVFGEEEIEGVQARSLQISPTVELTYAVFDGLAAIATDPEGIASLASGDGDLDGSDRYERATEDFDDELSLIAFFDLGQLVTLGEQLGLAEDPLYATFASDFRRLEALGIEISADDELLATDARLLLGDESGGGESAPAQSPSD